MISIPVWSNGSGFLFNTFFSYPLRSSCTTSNGQKLRGAEITFSGDYHMIPQGENAFILSNHQTWTDFYAIHTLAQRKGMLSRCRYFAKSSLKYIPFFG